MVSTNTSLTFYDFLNKIVIGFLLICLFGGFEISTAKCCCQTSPNVITIFEFLIASFISGLIFSNLVKYITSSLTNNKVLLQRAKQHVICDTKIEIRQIDDLSMIGDYYYYYYKLMKAGMLRNIPILEALESFVRQLYFVNILYVLNALVKYHMVNSTFIPILLFTCCCILFTYSFVKNNFYFTYAKSYNILGFLLVFLYLLGLTLLKLPLGIYSSFLFKFIPEGFTLLQFAVFGASMLGLYFLPYIWYKTQMTIHESVWEGGAYIMLLEKENNYQL